MPPRIALQIKVSDLMAQKFWRQVDKRAPDECWRWTGSLNWNGYGSFGFNHRTYKAHRVAYSLAKAAIPDGLSLDHLCLNKACVNPDHLEPVTFEENTRRAARHVDFGKYWRSQTHCKRGHEFTKDNVYVNTRGGRICKACQAIHSKKYHDRVRGQRRDSIAK